MHTYTFVPFLVCDLLFNFFREYHANDKQKHAYSNSNSHKPNKNKNKNENTNKNQIKHTHIIAKMKEEQPNNWQK